MTKNSDIYGNIEWGAKSNMNSFEQVKEYFSQAYDLPKDAIQPEFFDFLKVVAMGAKKYAMNNWLEVDGQKSSERDMHASMGRHWAESQHSMVYKVKGTNDSGRIRVFDKESQLDPLLHLQCRAAMTYTRRERNLIHPEDIK